MSLSQHQEIGPYILVDQIAVGGMAEIYLAKTRGLAGFEKYCALKVIHPDFALDEGFVQMLIDEAKITVGLSHANIAQIYELGRYKDTYYISMEYIDGGDLFRIMRSLSKKGVRVPVEVAAYIVQEVCTGLDYAHRRCDEAGKPRQIIHRDISPQNILVSYAGEVKIVDFGIAKAASRTRKTQTGVIKGKYFYMSPEQAWGDPVDPRTDIFSAGIVLYEILSGRMLYLEEDLKKLLHLARQADIPPIHDCRKDIPPQLGRVLMKALARRPEDRWQTAAQFQSALTGFLFSYAPDFTPERVAHLVRVALDDEAAESLPHHTPPLESDSAWRSDAEAFAAQSASVADAFDEQTPMDGHRPSKLTGSHDLDQTLVSGPPSMIDDSSETVVPSDDGWDDDWSDETQDLGGTASLARRRATARAGRPAAPAEVIVNPALPPASSTERLRPLDENSAAFRDGERTTGLEPTIVGDSGEDDARASSAERGGSAPRRKGEAPEVEDLDRNLRQADSPSRVARPEPADGAGSARLSKPQQQRSGATPPTAVAPPEAPFSGATTSDDAAKLTAATDPDPTRQNQSIGGKVGQTSHRPASAEDLAATPVQHPGARTTNPARSFGEATDTINQDLVLPAATAQRPHRHGWRALALALILTSAIAGGGIVLGLYVLPKIDRPATLEIISVPEGATVTLNGKRLKGRTRMVVRVDEADQPQRVTVSLPNYAESTTIVNLEGQPHKQVIASLVPKFGRLLLESEPSGAEVFVDGQAAGQTPLELEKLPLNRGPKLHFSKPGYASVTRQVEWDDQTWQRIKVVLQKPSTR